MVGSGDLIFSEIKIIIFQKYNITLWLESKNTHHITDNEGVQL